MAAARTLEVTDAQWEILGYLIPEPMRREDGHGRPGGLRRDVLNGMATRKFKNSTQSREYVGFRAQLKSHD